MDSQGQQKLWNMMANSFELTHNSMWQLFEKQPAIIWTVCILQGGAHEESRQETAVIATFAVNYCAFKTETHAPAWMVNAHLC